MGGSRPLLPALLWLAFGPPAAAADSAPDKAQFTLFHPVPADQLRDMDTDRPNKTDTPHTIDAGHVQVEIGLLDYAYDRVREPGLDARSDAAAFGLVNIRLGLLDNLEINAVVDAHTIEWDEDYLAKQSSRTDGVGDLTLGGKLNFWGDDAGEPWSTAMGIKPQVKLPTAGRGLGNGHTELFVEFPFLLVLPDDFNLALQTAVSRVRDSANLGYVAGWANSISIDHTLVADADFYVEYWSEVTTERHQEAQQTIDIGLTYPVTSNLVVDAGVNFGLNRASETLEWLAGFSFRY